MSSRPIQGKAGHPVLGVVLAVIGILIAMFFGLMSGVIGGGLALLFGLAGLLLGVSAHKKSSRGMGAIITGIIAIVTAVWMTFTAYNLVSAIQRNAREAGAPLMEQYASEPLYGIFGIISNAAEDNADSTALQEQLTFMTNYANGLLPAGSTFAPSAQ